MENNILKQKIVVTGGGSGGHISSASAFIFTLSQKYTLTDKNFLYIGGDLKLESEKPGMSLEKEIFSDEKFNQKYIRAGKLQRNISVKSIFLLLRTFLGFVDSFKIIKDFKPDIVLSTGGFVTVPVCLVSKMFNSKIYLHEQTAAIGLSNKIVSKIADRVFIAFKSSSQFFPKKKTVHVGNLVREEIFQRTGTGEVTEVVKEMIKQQESYPIIYISGGSLGSHIINSTVKDSLPNLLENFQIILQTGDSKKFNDYENILKKRDGLNESQKKKFFVTKYIHKNDIGFLLNNINLFVGRAGANTVYEMGVLKIPSILIPIPWVTHNEQQKNATILKNVGLASILNEGELTPEMLLLKIKNFSKKDVRYDTVSLGRNFPIDSAKKMLKYMNL